MVVKINSAESKKEKSCEKEFNRFINGYAMYSVAVKKKDYDLYFNVIKVLVGLLQNAMKEADAYYNKYISEVKFAGSHDDNLRITKPDEFDIVFNIGLPVRNTEFKASPYESDIVIGPQEPGFLELQVGSNFLDLPEKSDYEINQTAYGWADSDGFLLRSKFKDWFKKVVWKAFNQFDSRDNLPVFKVKNREYTIGRTEFGPAITLIVEDDSGFYMDVDLVPALVFPIKRWPPAEGYRRVTSCKKGHWLVVPKPNKSDIDDENAISRTWMPGMQEQEAAMMFNKHFLKPTIRLMKKLRDTQGMKKIVSYHIKTLFLWEISRQKEIVWQCNPAVLFKFMVQRLYDALELGEIKYFWNEEYNMIENVSRSVLNEYCNKLERLIYALKPPVNTGVVERRIGKYVVVEREDLRRVLNNNITSKEF